MPNKSARKKRVSHSNHGWKVVQQTRQNTQKTKLAFITLGIILSIIFLAQVVKFAQTMFHPWKDNSINRITLWKSDFNINLIIKAKGISLLSYNPHDNKIGIIDLSDQIYLESSHGFGNWQLGSIYGLGESQKNLGGPKLLVDTLRNLLGLPIDGLLDFSGKYAAKLPVDIVSEIRKSPFSIISLISYLKTNLTPFELLRLNLKLSSVRFDKVKQIHLEQIPDLLQSNNLLDGTGIHVLDTIKFDAILSVMVDPVIQNEHKTIAIFNTTNHPGLAQKAARIISNIGGDVIITANSQDLLKQTKITGEKSKTLDRLRQIFKLGDIIQSKDKDIISSRAQINLFLGEDYFEQL